MVGAETEASMPPVPGRPDVESSMLGLVSTTAPRSRVCDKSTTPLAPAVAPPPALAPPESAPVAVPSRPSTVPSRFPSRAAISSAPMLVGWECDACRGAERRSGAKRLLTHMRRLGDHLLVEEQERCSTLR